MNHDQLQEALDSARVGIPAAAAHGRLCGALCVRAPYGAAEWLRDLSEHDGAGDPPAPGSRLHDAHHEALESLGSPDFGFAPLLPGDEAPIAERVAALADWCDGFLYGIGTSARGRELPQQGPVSEFLGDLAAIARVELEADRGASAAEGDFTELFEFVRAGAQLAWIELARMRSHEA